MLECNVILTLFAYMVTFTLFICLIQIQNADICTVYRKSAKKYRDINFCSYCPALLGRNVHLVIYCSIRPLVVSGQKPKAFFFPN